MKFIDALLNRITMYRLMLYYLGVLYVAAIVLSFFNILSYEPTDFIFSGVYILGICYVANQLFARLFKVKPNYESQYITGLILSLIIGPVPLFQDTMPHVPNIGFLMLAGVAAMGSKYLLVINKQHIFNPAAFAVVITALFLDQGASWWAGDRVILPLVIIGGLLVIRKINHFGLVISFLLSSSASLLLFNFNKISPSELITYIVNPTTLFFAFVMLTEPITSPANKKMRLYFGAFTGFIFFAYQAFLGVFYTLELALLTANALGRILHFSTKYRFILEEKKELAPHIWEFAFTSHKPVNFVPGQFLEWSLPHSHADSRGHRRYFTIASSPIEKKLLITVKIPEKSSSYKQALIGLKPGNALFATNLEGEFVLQKNPHAKYIFIAGGIGITPFRSIIKYMLDKNLSSTITLFYVAHDISEFVFDEIFEQAKETFGLQIIHVVSENPPQDWKGEVGRLTNEVIKKHVDDYLSRIFYLSGPQPMIMAYKDLLKNMGITSKNIKTDYFPGYEG